MGNVCCVSKNSKERQIKIDNSPYVDAILGKKKIDMPMHDTEHYQSNVLLSHNAQIASKNEPHGKEIELPNDVEIQNEEGKGIKSVGEISSQNLERSISKLEKTNSLSRIIDQYRDEYMPCNYSDTQYDFVADTKTFMNTLQDQMEIYLKNNDIFEEGYKFVLRFLDTTFAWLLCMEVVIEERNKLNEKPKKNFEFFNFCSRPTVPVVNNRPSFIRTKVASVTNKILSECCNEKFELDWRIGKKILQIKGKENNYIRAEMDPSSLLKSFEIEINKALDFLSWKNDEQNFLLTTWTLKHLKKLIKLVDNNNIIFNINKAANENKKKKEALIQAIITGRFNKNLFGLENTLILGEDGGLFMLLNNRNFLANSVLSSDDLISKKFLDSKTVQIFTGDKTKNKLIIGEGGFGKVRFALSLFLSKKTNPGDIVCLKKTKSYKKMNEKISQKDKKKVLSEGEALFEITENTLKDYFANDIAEIIKAPAIIDLAIINNESVDENHKKGYLMMEVLAQNSGKITFETEKYQKWEYQKPFLLDIFEGTLKMLEMNIVQTDLKSENTLFDPITRKATIIDLGGILKMRSQEDVMKFNPSFGGYDSTATYCPPELNPDNDSDINLNLSLVYICGVILKEVTMKTDLPKENMETIKTIVSRTTSENPLERDSLNKLIADIKKIGDDKYKENVLAKGYIESVMEKIAKDRTSLSLNEEILTTKEVFIKIDLTKQNPIRFENQETVELSIVMEKFLEEDQPQQVLLILGSAGSGKSIALQIKFIEAVHDWEPGKPLPVYFNLANETSLEKNFEILNKQLRSNIDPKNANVHLFVDSFDEGFDMEVKRSYLIKDYIYALGENSKMIISCRTEYLNSENDLVWFQTKDNNLLHYYITPFTYGNKKDLKAPAKVWLDKKGNMQLKKLNTAQNEKILQLIERRDIKGIIDTGYIFDLVMTTLPVFLSSKDNSTNNLSKFLLYTMYLDIYLEKKISQLNYNQQLKLKILLENGLAAIPNSFDFKEIIKYFSLKKITKLSNTKIARTRRESLNKEACEISKTLSILVEAFGVYLAYEIYKTRKFRIDCGNSPIFKALGFQAEKPFRDQDICYALNLLPMKIEMRKHEKNVGETVYEVQTGFAHDIIKNLFLFKGIEFEMIENKTSKIFSSNNISRNVEFVRFLIDSFDASHKNNLKNFIQKSKTDNSKEAALLSANSMTILVAMGENFAFNNLENVNIAGANLRNGNFKGASFQGACLKGVELRHANLDSGNFTGANMDGINLGIYPNIGLRDTPDLISFSLDENKMTCFFRNPEIMVLYDTNTGLESKIQVYNVRLDTFVCKAISGNGNILAVGFENHIELWDFQELSKIKDIEHEKIDQNYKLIFNQHYDILYVRLFLDEKKIEFEEVENNTSKITIDMPIFDQFVDEIYYFSASSCSRKFGILSKKMNEENYSNYYLIVVDLKSLNSIAIKLESKVSCFAFSKDVKTVIIACEDDNEPPLLLYDIQNSTTENNKLVKKLKGQTKTVTKVKYSIDGKRILGGSRDFCIRVWDALSGQLLQTLLGLNSETVSLCFSLDGDKFAAASKEMIRIWNANTGETYKKLDSHKASISALCFNREGNLFASSSLDETVRVWDTNSGKQLYTIMHEDSVYFLAFSNDGAVIATACGDKNVYFWNAKSGDKIKSFQAHSSKVKTLAFSLDGKLLSTGGDDKFVKIWDSNSCNLLREMEGHADTILTLEFVNEFLASGSKDCTVRIWNKNGGFVALIKFQLEVKCLKFHIFEKVLYACSGSQIYIFEISKELQNFNPNANQPLEIIANTSEVIQTENTVYCLTIGIKNNFIVAGSGNDILIYDYNTRKLLQNIDGHLFNVKSVAFSKDENLIATGSDDSMIGLWAQDKDRSIFKTSSHWHEHEEEFMNYNKAIVDESIDLDNQVFLGHLEESNSLVKSQQEFDSMDLALNNDSSKILRKEDNNLLEELIQEHQYSKEPNQDNNEPSQLPQALENDMHSDISQDDHDHDYEKLKEELNLGDKENSSDLLVSKLMKEEHLNYNKNEHEHECHACQNEAAGNLETIYKWKFFTSKLENDLSAKDMILENAKVSKVDELVFKQRGAKIGENILEKDKTEKLLKNVLVLPIIQDNLKSTTEKRRNFISCKILTN